MTTTRQKKKARAKARKAELTAKAEALEDEDVELEEAPSEDEAVADSDQKDMVVVEEYRPFGGATSWSELDLYMEAREAAAEIRETTWELEALIDNILASDMTPKDKAKAISDAAFAFQARAVSKKEAEDAVCTCGCEAEEPVPNSGFLNTIRNALDASKAKISTSSRNNLPDSAFAYIEPGGKKDESGKTVPRSLRHYPIQDKAHVRNALARASAAIKKGGKTAEIARKALPKIRAAAKRLGIQSSDKKSSFAIQKDLQGHYRWFGWVSNKFRDRDASQAPRQGGEIITELAHKEYVAFLDKNPDLAPESWIWHTPGTARKARVDWWDYADGFLVMSGPMTEEEGKSAEETYAEVDAGMSHGFFGLKDGQGHIIAYRTFEVSDLPHGKAANPWTDFEAIRKEVTEMGFTAEKRSHLVRLLGEERVSQLEGSTEDMAKELLAAGVEFKDLVESAPGLSTAATGEAEPAEEAEEPEGAEQAEESTAAGAQEVLEALGVKELDAFLTKMRADLDANTATLTAMAETVETLKKTDDEKIAEKIQPRVGPEPIWLKALSRKQETVMQPDDPLAPAKPTQLVGEDSTIDWVQRAFGTIDPS